MPCYGLFWCKFCLGKKQKLHLFLGGALDCGGLKGLLALVSSCAYVVELGSRELMYLRKS